MGFVAEGISITCRYSIIPPQKGHFFHFFFLLKFFYPYSIIPPQPFSLLVRTPAEGYLPVPSHRNVEETWTEYKQRPTS